MRCAALGLVEGDRLGMRFRLGFEWFVIQRALQKLGVVQVAVNWRLTPDEAIYIINDSGAKGLACNDRDASPWATHDLGLLVTVGDNNPGHPYEDLLRARRTDAAVRADASEPRALHVGNDGGAEGRATARSVRRGLRSAGPLLARRSVVCLPIRTRRQCS